VTDTDIALPPVPTAEQRLTWNCLECDAFWMDGKLEQRGDDPTCIHGDIQRLTECCGNPVDPDIRRCSCGAGV
jgi:hypothetical protein